MSHFNYAFVVESAPKKENKTKQNTREVGLSIKPSTGTKHCHRGPQPVPFLLKLKFNVDGQGSIECTQ